MQFFQLVLDETNSRIMKAIWAPYRYIDWCA